MAASLTLGTVRTAPNLKTVGLILGPYRNLTTLTAAVLSLHPSTQVLNHAGKRLLTGRRNFIERPDEARLDRFVDAALSASTEGRRGTFGGSIQFSHAFDRENLRESYQRRYGDRAMKDDVRCFIWKESGARHPTVASKRRRDREVDGVGAESTLLATGTQPARLHAVQLG